MKRQSITVIDKVRVCKPSDNDPAQECQFITHLIKLPRKDRQAMTPQRVLEQLYDTESFDQGPSHTMPSLHTTTYSVILRQEVYVDRPSGESRTTSIEAQHGIHWQAEGDVPQPNVYFTAGTRTICPGCNPALAKKGGFYSVAPCIRPKLPLFQTESGKMLHDYPMYSWWKCCERCDKQERHVVNFITTSKLEGKQIYVKDGTEAMEVIVRRLFETGVRRNCDVACYKDAYVSFYLHDFVRIATELKLFH